MRFLVFIFLILYNHSLIAKEWKSIKQYQKLTQREKLSPSDWLKSDRIKNTVVWQNANRCNLKHNLYQEYLNIVQRRDFYKWLSSQFYKKGHEVVWVKMAHFISKKMHIMEVFPFSLFTKKEIKIYAKAGSETVFNKAFTDLQLLYHSSKIIKDEDATVWDNRILYKEQYIWVNRIYKKINPKSLKTLERIAKRKFLYAFVVPRVVQFKGDLSNPEARFNYAIKILKPYCEKAYK